LTKADCPAFAGVAGQTHLIFEAWKGNLNSFAALRPCAFALKKLPTALPEKDI
jgi:hypothetical protein